MSSAAPPAGAEPALAIPRSAARAAVWLPAHAALNVNEGPNAGQAGRAFGAGPLYPVSDAVAADNYPPLSRCAVGCWATTSWPDSCGRWRPASALVIMRTRNPGARTGCSP